MAQSKKKSAERLAWVRSIGGEGAEDGGSIFGSATDEEVASLPAQEGRRIQLVDASVLEDNPYQHRHRYKNLESLAEKMRSLGFRGSLPVRPHPAQLEHYQLAYGHRRKRAAQLAGVQVPIEIIELTDEEMIKLAVSENREREDLTPLEEGESFLQMNREFRLSLQDIAEFIGEGKNDTISRGYVRNRVTAAKLAEQFAFVRSWLEAYPHASLRAIAALEGLDERGIRFMLTGMSQKDWTADTVEKVARTLKAGGEQAETLLGSLELVEASTEAAVLPEGEAPPETSQISLPGPDPDSIQGSASFSAPAATSPLSEGRGAAAVSTEMIEREPAPGAIEASRRTQRNDASPEIPTPPRTDAQKAPKQAEEGVEALQRLALIQDVVKRAQRYAARLGKAKPSQEEEQWVRDWVQLGQELLERK